MKKLGMLLFALLLLFTGVVNANDTSPPSACLNADEGTSQVQALANELQSNLSMNATKTETESAIVDSLNTLTLQLSGVAVLQNLQNPVFNNSRVGFVKNAQSSLLSNLTQKGRANDIKNLAEMPGGTVSFKSLNLSDSTGLNRGAIMLTKWPIGQNPES